MSSDGGDKLLNGTPEERIQGWLELTKNEEGHFKQGVSDVPDSQEPQSIFFSFIGNANVLSNTPLGLDGQPYASPPSPLPRHHWPSPVRHL